jgi:hypothetical protein
MRMTTALIGVVLVLVVVGYFVFARKHPENAAGHDSGDPTSATDFFGNSDDRPAGPGAEAEGVVGDGQIAPGPSADSLPSEPSDLSVRDRSL